MWKKNPSRVGLGPDTFDALSLSVGLLYYFCSDNQQHVLQALVLPHAAKNTPSGTDDTIGSFQITLYPISLLQVYHAYVLLSKLLSSVDFYARQQELL